MFAIGAAALAGIHRSYHGHHHDTHHSGHHPTLGRRLVRPGTLVLSLAEMGRCDLVQVLSQPIEALIEPISLRPPLNSLRSERLGDAVHPEHVAVEPSQLFAHEQYTYPVAPLCVPGLAFLAQFYPPAVRCRAQSQVVILLLIRDRYAMALLLEVDEPLTPPACVLPTTVD